MKRIATLFMILLMVAAVLGALKRKDAPQLRKRSEHVRSG